MQNRDAELLEQSTITNRELGAALAASPGALTGTALQLGPVTLTGRVMVYATGDFHIAIGANPTATTNNMRFPGLQTQVFNVPVGMKISIVKGTGVTDGTLWANEVGPVI